MESSHGGHSTKLASSATQSFEVQFWFWLYFLGTFGSLMLWWSWNPNQTSNDWVVPTLTLEATNVSEWWSKVPYWTLNDWVAPILSLEANFVQWPPRLFSIKSYQLVPNVPEWWSWNPNWTSNDWVAPVLTLEASFVLWPHKIQETRSQMCINGEVGIIIRHL